MANKPQSPKLSPANMKAQMNAGSQGCCKDADCSQQNGSKTMDNRGMMQSQMNGNSGMDASK